MIRRSLGSVGRVGLRWSGSSSLGGGAEGRGPGLAGDYRVREEGDEAESPPYSVGRYIRPLSTTPYHYDSEKYINRVYLQGRIHGRVFFNTTADGQEFATFLLSTKKRVESPGEPVMVYESIHRIVTWRKGQIDLLLNRNLGSGCRVHVSGKISYYNRSTTGSELAEGLKDEEMRYHEVQITAQDIMEIHTAASSSPWRDPCYVAQKDASARDVVSPLHSSQAQAETPMEEAVAEEELDEDDEKKAAMASEGDTDSLLHSTPAQAETPTEEAAAGEELDDDDEKKAAMA